MIGGAMLVLLITAWVALEGWPGRHARERVAPITVATDSLGGTAEAVDRVVVGSRAKPRTARVRKRDSQRLKTRAIGLSAPTTPSQSMDRRARKQIRRRPVPPTPVAAPATEVPGAVSQVVGAAPTAAITPAAAPAASPDPVSDALGGILSSVENLLPR